MQLILDTQGLRFAREGQFFLVSAGEINQRINPAKVSSIAVTRACTLETDAIQLALKHEIPILLLDRYGRVQGQFWSPYFGSIATLRRRQAEFVGLPRATDWIIDLLLIKLEGAEAVLQTLQHKLRPSKDRLEEGRWRMQEQGRRLAALRGRAPIEARQAIMAAEAATMKPYWQALGKSLPPPYQFDKRSRMPAQDPFNALINYGYGMLYGVVETALFSAGLDPHLGVLHADQHDKPTLAFDLIEPFRPWVDKLAVGYALEGHIRAEYFTTTTQGVLLSKAGKAFFIPAFNDLLADRIRWQGRDSSGRNHIYRMAAHLAALLREDPADAPTP